MNNRLASRSVRWSTAMTIGLACLAGAPAASALPSFTWSGKATGGTNKLDWSNGADWVGGHAPATRSATSTRVQKLTFPALPSGCVGACYDSANDLTGVKATSLAITGPYRLSGNPLTLGAAGDATSGLTANTPDGFSVGFPIALATAQTWSFTGTTFPNYGFSSPVTGASPLTLAVHGTTFLGFANHTDNEVGPVKLTQSVTGSYGALGVGDPGAPARLNYTDGKSITVGGGTSLVGFDSETGPVTVSGGGAQFQIGQPSVPTGAASVRGAVSFGGGALAQIFITHSGSLGGTDYSQLSATGTVSIANGAIVFLASTFGSCPALTVGAVDTLIKAGGLSGSFINAPQGSSMNICSTFTQPVKINYTAHAVTATVEKPSPGCQFVFANTKVGKPTSIQLSCTDPTGQPLSYAIISKPTHGTLSAISTAHKVTYTPKARFTGQDSFTYKATSLKWGSSPPATVYINVSTAGVAAPRPASPSVVVLTHGRATATPVP